MNELLLTILATVGAVVFGSAQSILVPVLIASFKESLGTPYYILLVSAFFFVLIFFCIYLPVQKKTDNPLWSFNRGSWIIFGLTGGFDALTGIFIVYASDATRTPIVLQTILAGTTIVFTMVISKKVIESKKDIKFKNKFVIGSLVLLLLSVIISTIPQYTHTKWSPWSTFWLIVYLLGMGCRATYNTLQEKYIEIKGDNFSNKITILFWTCFFQFFIMGLLIWVDLIPGFGYSTPSTFGEETKNFFECYFAISCKWTLLLGLSFVAAYTGSYFSAIYLNAKSANYSMLANTLIAPTVIVFFTIFPHLNEGIKYPIYITIPAISLNIFSVVLWKYWEIHVAGKRGNYESFD